MESHDAIERKSLADVVAGCSEETRRFRQGTQEPSPNCLELFRRAILGGCQPAWQHIVQQYEALVRHWIGPPHESVEDLAQDTWSAFVQAVTPERWERGEFPTLAGVLAYLRMTAISQVIKEKRRRELEDQAVQDFYQSLSSPPDASPFTQVSRQELVAAIYARLVDDQERWLVRLMFEYGMKPAQVARVCPEHFPDVRTVYRVRNRVVQRLQRDPSLRHWLA